MVISATILEFLLLFSANEKETLLYCKIETRILLEQDHLYLQMITLLQED